MLQYLYALNNEFLDEIQRFAIRPTFLSLTTQSIVYLVFKIHKIFHDPFFMARSSTYLIDDTLPDSEALFVEESSERSDSNALSDSSNNNALVDELFHDVEDTGRPKSLFVSLF